VPNVSSQHANSPTLTTLRRGRQDAFSALDHAVKSEQTRLARLDLSKARQREIDAQRDRLTGLVATRALAHAVKLIDPRTVDATLFDADMLPAVTAEQAALLIRLCGIRI
jgi:hypothetical protein